MQSRKKQVLEFFQKDPWPVRLTVLAMLLIFLLVLAALLLGSLNKAPWLVTLLRLP